MATSRQSGTNSELNSTIFKDAYQIYFGECTGITRSGGQVDEAAPEANTVVNLPSLENPNGMNVTVRGLLPIGLKMREDAKLKEGRWNDFGKREVVVGEGIAARYPSARVGESLKFGRGTWQVVGVFSAGDSAANSEIWADLNQLRGDFESRGGSNSLLVRLDSPASVDTFKKAIDNDQRLNAQAMGEPRVFLIGSAKIEHRRDASVHRILHERQRWPSGVGFAATNTMRVCRGGKKIARRSQPHREEPQVSGRRSLILGHSSPSQFASP